MVEYLALPAWETAPTTVDAWVASLSETAGPVVVRRESSTVAWLEVARLRLRAYVVLENGHPTAINFEIHSEDPGPATRVLASSAEALGWELHADDEDDRDSAEDDDDDDQ